MLGFATQLLRGQLLAKEHPKGSWRAEVPARPTREVRKVAMGLISLGLIDGLMNGYVSQWPLIPSPDASELGR
jgi:hypothetical protein